MLADFHQYSMLSKGSHGDVYQFFILILLDNGNHLLDDKGFCLKLKGFIAICIIEDHLIDGNGYSMHILNLILLFLMLPKRWRKKYGILLHHCVFISKIACKQNSPHVPLEKDHSSARDMFRIEQGELHMRQIFSNFDVKGLVVVVRIDVFELRVLVHQISSGLMCAVDVSVVPKGGQSFVVVAMEMREKVVKGAPRE